MRRVSLLLLLGACGFSVGGAAPSDSGAPPSDASPDARSITWDIDTTSGKPLPSTRSQWIDFLAATSTSIAPPDGLWLFQEASGAVLDAIGDVDLTRYGTGPLAYGVAVPGWTRTALATTDGGYAGVANTGAASLPDVSVSSMTILLVVAFPSAPSGSRSFLFEGAEARSKFGRADIDTARRLHFSVATTTTTGTLDHGGDAFPVMMKLDRQHEQEVLISDRDTIALDPYTPLGSSRGLFVGGADLRAPDARFLYMAAWYGAHAEIDDADLNALLDALGW